LESFLLFGEWDQQHGFHANTHGFINGITDFRHAADHRYRRWTDSEIYQLGRRGSVMRIDAKAQPSAK
jgi:hypothetical protein